MTYVRKSAVPLPSYLRKAVDPDCELSSTEGLRESQTDYVEVKVTQAAEDTLTAPASRGSEFIFVPDSINDDALYQNLLKPGYHQSLK